MTQMKRYLYHNQLDLEGGKSECDGMITRLYSRNRSEGHGRLTRTEYSICEKCGALFYRPGIGGRSAERVR